MKNIVNTVTIDLEKYDRLKEALDHKKANTVVVRKSFTDYYRVDTENNAIAELANDLKLEKEKNYKLEKELHVVKNMSISEFKKMRESNKLL